MKFQKGQTVTVNYLSGSWTGNIIDIDGEWYGVAHPDGVIYIVNESTLSAEESQNQVLNEDFNYKIP